MGKNKTDAADSEKLLDELDMFYAENAAVPSSCEEDDGLPFESLDDFSTDPVGFEEMAERMLAKTENIFDLSAVYNRHSKKYLKTCALLEKGIKFLGSACITKLALEDENRSCPALGQLSTQKLYGMVSFNYRKLDKALTENQQKKCDLYPELTDMFFRYFNLLQRLRSTENKIDSYYDKKYDGNKDYGPYLEGNAFTGMRIGSRRSSKPAVPSVFHRAPAFPLLDLMPGQDSACSAGTGCPAAVSAPAATMLPEEAEPAAVPAALPEAEPSESEPDMPADAADPAEAEAEMQLESEIRWAVRMDPEAAYREMHSRLQDVFFCQDHPDYARIFRKILRELKT